MRGGEPIHARGRGSISSKLIIVVELPFRSYTRDVISVTHETHFCDLHAPSPS